MIRRKICIACFILALNTGSCIKSEGPLPPKNISSTDDCSGTPGPLFIAVKNLISQHCISCHNNNFSNGGVSFAADCNIVLHKARIKIRAVDEGSMPPRGPLSETEKNKIIAWMNAGGQYGN